MSIAQFPIDSTNSDDSMELVLVQGFINNIAYASNVCIASCLLIWPVRAHFFVSNFSQYVWLAGIMVVFLFGYGMAWYGKRKPPTAASYLRWRSAITAYAIFCGASWGLAPAWMVLTQQAVDVGFLVTMLLAVSSVSVSLSVSERSAMLYFFGFTLGPIAMALIFQMGSANGMIGVVLLIALILMMITGNKAHQGLRGRLLTEMRLRTVLTEARVAREHAEKASAFKSQFLANMSHEIRTPMNAVLGMLKLLQHTELSDRQLNYALKGEDAAKALLGLLNDILDFSKLEAGKVILDLQPMSIRTLIDDLMVILQANAAHKDLYIGSEVDPRVPPYVLGDALRLRQVLINLGANAIKFTERGHVLLKVQWLGSDGDGTRLEFSVEDTGIGIASDKQSSIFEEFTQAENTIARRFGGTGLGLSISQQLVKAMGSSIHVESVSGVGSTFSFELRMQTLVQPSDVSLPAPSDEREAVHRLNTDKASHGDGESDQLLKEVAPRRHITSLRRLQNMRLLVVEDNLLNQQIALELLTYEGAYVEVADHGEHGIEVLTQAKVPFDAMLLDLQMPNMDGFAVTRVIREKLGMHNFPIIAMTANAMESDRQACLDAGMNAHVSKPFHIDYLVAVLQKHSGSAVCVEA